MTKLNVLQLTTDSKIGGAENVVLWLARGINKKIFNISICCLAPKGPLFDEANKEGIAIYSLELKYWWDLFKAFKLIKLLKDKQIHILHSHLFHANILSRIIGRLAGVPIIISTEHIMGLEAKWRLVLNKLTSKWVTRYIAVSFAVGGFLKDKVGIGQYKISVVQNGIDPKEHLTKENMLSEFGFTNMDKIVGTVARIHKQKGHRYLLYAVKDVIRIFPDTKFLIIGDGPLKNKMEKLSFDLQISNNVIFTGFRNDVLNIMSIFDIFVLPSLWEGLPITILEAMSMKKSVVATNVSGNSEIVEDSISGILVAPGQPAQLAQAIIRLLNDETLRIKMGEAGRRKIVEHFNLDRMIGETTLIYKELIRERLQDKIT